MRDMYEQALIIATLAHDGIKRWNGDAYITHPIRVSNTFEDEIHRTVAVLHDVVEDTDVTAADLRKEFPDEIVDAVIALTKRYFDENETYKEFILRSKKNPIARLVKIADINDNMRDLDKGSMFRKYTKALNELTKDE
jgi:(p)ppGpp synthase/HD superfamily hydrolase